MKQRIKHDYTSELDLKSLLIRVKNKKVGKKYSEKYNSRINKYIKTYVKLTNKKYPKESGKLQRKIAIRHKLKDKIIKLSEMTNIDSNTYEHFGYVVILMIKSILTKPNFSGYTYKTDFYSDATYKILNYLHNFNHTLISKISGVEVNAFAYISQIIHNSIVFVINQKKKEQKNINKQVVGEINDHKIDIKNYNKEFHSTLESKYEFKEIPRKEFKIKIQDSLVEDVKKIIENEPKDEKITVYYPGSYKITMEEYYDLKPLLKNLSIVRY